jgi:hypothetical protein
MVRTTGGPIHRPQYLPAINIPAVCREAWTEFQRAGRCEISLQVNVGFVAENLMAIAYKRPHGAALRFLAGCDPSYSGDALRLWESVRKFATTDQLLNIEARRVMIVAVENVGAPPKLTRAQVRKHDDAVISAARQLVDQIHLHPDYNVRHMPPARLYPSWTIEDIRLNLKDLVVPDLIAGRDDIAPRARPAADYVLARSPRIDVLATVLAREIEQLASARMQQAKKRPRAKFARENRLVDQLAPDLIARYPDIKKADITKLITYLAKGLWHSPDDPFHAIEKQVQRLP